MATTAVTASTIGIGTSCTRPHSPNHSDNSPNKPDIKEEPDIPTEVAMMQKQVSSVSKIKKTIDDAGPSSTPDSPEEVGTDLGCLPLDGVITESMLKEEKQLHLKSEKEEKIIQEQSKSEWQKEEDEQRYRRLKHLLEKSSIYSSFLLDKMEEQQRKEKLRQETRAKKLTKKLAAEEAEEEVKGEEEKENKETKNVSSNARSIRRSGRTKKQQETAGKMEVTSPPSKGRKRRLESYSIADYIDKSTLTSKRIKTETQEAVISHGSKTQETHEGSRASQQSGSSSEEARPQEPGSVPTMSKPEDDFVDTFSRTVNGEKISDLQPDLFTGGRLRDYQLRGIEWLKVLYENGVNGILGDEMGLGKTVQCIGLFAHVIKMGVPGPFLVVAPLSTLGNWMSEFERFTPTIKVILYHGLPPEREALRRQIRKQFGEYKTHPVIVTSYEIIMRDRKYLAKHLWKYIIVDEGHRIKNLNCRLIRELKMYHTANRLLLTGTPLQNNLAELWSMLNFLLPEVFDDLRTFESWFDISTLTKLGGDEAIVAKEREQHVVSMLHQILTPFLLRRLKSDVELKIPPKKEILVQAPLTGEQAELYRDIVDKTILGKMKTKHARGAKAAPVEVTPGGRFKRRCRANVNYAVMVGDSDGDENEDEDDDIEEWMRQLDENAERCQNAGKRDPNEGMTKNVELNIKIKNIMMQLRKCCNHPYLLEYPLDPETQEYKIDEDLISCSGKLMVLDRLLPALKERGHKVLIFSQMVRMLDLIEDYCYLRKHGYCRLDGQMALADRKEQIDAFNKDPDIFLFLLSTRAGGLGINLTSADTVIIYDSDWNPQSDLQAQDRCHRIGQTKPVVIYRMVTSNTIDQRIVERAAAKRRLEKMVIHQGKFKGGKTNLAKDSRSLVNPAELLELLRSTDHSGFVRNCDEKVISDADLGSLLDRSDLMAKFRGKQLAAGKAKRRMATGSEKEGVFKVLEGGPDEEAGLGIAT